ncbi:MAG: hypothetical protein PVI86_10135 [Phycisphaerae bacterium]|jgi:hypothetical protein
MAQRKTPENTPELVEVFKALARNRCECFEAWGGLKSYDSLIPPGQNQPEKDVVEQAFDEWTRAKRRYLRHPLVELCRMVEERSDISRDELLHASARINSKVGLRAATWSDGDPDWPDLTWIPPELKELDRGGSTPHIVELLHEYCQQQGFDPEEMDVPPLPKASKRTGKKTRRQRPKRPEPTHRQKQALLLRERRYTFEQIGHELGVTKQAAEGLVKRGLATKRSSGRSVTTQPLPTDHRGQVTTVTRKRPRPKKDD